MDEVVRRSAAPYRFRTTVVVGFAALALLLAAVGIYGVVSVLAQARQRELAIRRALGSTAAGLMRLVVRQGLLPVGLGIVLGCAGVALSARLDRIPPVRRQPNERRFTRSHGARSGRDREPRHGARGVEVGDG